VHARFRFVFLCACLFVVYFVGIFSLCLVCVFCSCFFAVCFDRVFSLCFVCVCVFSLSVLFVFFAVFGGSHHSTPVCLSPEFLPSLNSRTTRAFFCHRLGVDGAKLPATTGPPHIVYALCLLDCISETRRNRQLCEEPAPVVVAVVVIIWDP
jgi:hypothetical protein